ncbi:MAG TPA: RNA methyltransferase [Bacteroidales bacterium]|nr:RNA methyltransferase [Bacteroidales bacterium]
MISKNRIKYIISLQRKKTRDEEKLYIIEGDKIVKEFLAAGITVDSLVAKPEFISSLPAGLLKNVKETEEVSYNELKQVSALKTPHNALAIINMPDNLLELSIVRDELTVALDFIQDPGNLGTIIRAAGWFGIRHIICSPDCVDVYNPKVVQASMGALLQTNVYYTDLEKLFIFASGNKIPVFGTLLEGEPVYGRELGREGIILLGNESKGISEKYKKYVTDPLMIPRFGISGPGIDSLNVGMAASVIFSEFRRRSYR